MKVSESYDGKNSQKNVNNGNLNVEIVIDAVLSATAGLLMGEAMNILGKRKQFNENAPEQSQPEPFIINQ